MDLIDRSEVLYKFAEILPEADSLEWYEQAKPDEVKGLVDELYSIVLNMNRIDAQPVKRGKWIQMDEYHAKCSVCGWWQKTNGKCCTGHANIHNAVYKYCTVCGSKMGGDTDGNEND